MVLLLLLLLLLTIMIIIITDNNEHITLPRDLRLRFMFSCLFYHTSDIDIMSFLFIHLLDTI